MPKLTGIEGIIGSTSHPQPGGKPSTHQPNPPTAVRCSGHAPTASIRPPGELLPTPCAWVFTYFNQLPQLDVGAQVQRTRPHDGQGWTSTPATHGAR
jgi:hypothetical protein